MELVLFAIGMSALGLYILYKTCIPHDEKDNLGRDLVNLINPLLYLPEDEIEESRKKEIRDFIYKNFK